MSINHNELRRAVNEEGAWVREDDLNALDKGQKEKIAVFRDMKSDSPTGRFLTKGDIWQRALAPQDVEIGIRSSSSSGVVRWNSGLHQTSPV